jgi:hypothetical protein
MKKSKEAKNDTEELIKLNNTKSISFANFCNKYILLVAGIIILTIGVFAFIFTAYFEGDYQELTETTLYRIDNPFLTFIWVSVAILILFLLCTIFKKIKSRNIFIILLLISITVQFLWIFEIRFIPIYDQYSVIHCAELLLDGDTEYFSSASSYFGYYPFSIRNYIFYSTCYKDSWKNRLFSFTKYKCNMFNDKFNFNVFDNKKII